VTVLLNYQIGRIVLGSMCVGVSVWLGWSGIRVADWARTPAQPRSRQVAVQVSLMPDTVDTVL